MPKRRKGEVPAERWYYDACALETSIIYDEIINNTRSYRKLTASFLSLGEAYGNCFRDGKGENAPANFVELINELRKLDKLDIVSNADIEDEFEFVRNLCEIRLEVADAVHLATAIKNRCNIFRTFDDDFNFTSQQIAKIKEKYHLHHGFALQKRQTPIK